MIRLLVVLFALFSLFGCKSAMPVDEYRAYLDASSQAAKDLGARVEAELLIDPTGSITFGPGLIVQSGTKLKIHATFAP